MKGFIIDNIGCEVSEPKSEKIEVTTPRDEKPRFVDGREFRTAKCVIEFTSTGDVSEIQSEGLLRKINEKLDQIIEFED